MLKLVILAVKEEYVIRFFPKNIYNLSLLRFQSNKIWWPLTLDRISFFPAVYSNAFLFLVCKLAAVQPDLNNYFRYDFFFHNFSWFSVSERLARRNFNILHLLQSFLNRVLFVEAVDHTCGDYWIIFAVRKYFLPSFRRQPIGLYILYVHFVRT